METRDCESLQLHIVSSSPRLKRSGNSIQLKVKRFSSSLYKLHTKTQQIRRNLQILLAAKNPGGGEGGYLGQFLLAMCCWPLGAPTPLQSILWPIIDPILFPFRQICNFRDPNLVTFYFYELTNFFRLNEEHFIFHLQYKHSGTFDNRKYEELSYPQKSENMRPHYSQSSPENTNSSSATSPLAPYKEVLSPAPPPLPQEAKSRGGTLVARAYVTCYYRHSVEQLF